MSGEFSLSFEGKDGAPLRVDAAVSMMHPEQCTFTVSEPLYPDRSAHFASREQSLGSPLIDRLFGIEAVAEVLVSDNTVTVTLGGQAGWDDVVPEVGKAIHDVLLGSDPAIAPAVTESQLPAEEIRERVQKVLDEVINPAVGAHGGFVNLLEVANNTVYLEFGGGCQGCGMINVTLKYGVERSIREQVPEIGEILDSTDHAAGRNPYYQPSSK
jgi:Fe-S cluster biogenesis protein NfuA